MGETSNGHDETGAVRVEFRLTDPSYPFVDVSRAETCRVDLQMILPRSKQEYVEYFGVDGVDPTVAHEQFATFESVEAKVLDRHGTGGVIELVAAFWEHAQAYYRHPDGTPTGPSSPPSWRGTRSPSSS